MLRSAIAKTLLVVILVLAQTTTGFLPANHHGVPPFAARHAFAREPTCLYMVSTITGFAKNVWGKVTGSQKRLQTKARELVDQANATMSSFEDYLVESMKQRSDQVTQQVAVKLVKMINGHWDVAIATNKNETKKMMQGAIDDVADILVDSIGLAEGEEKDQVKAELKEYRLSIAQTFDASVYPLRVQVQVLVGPGQVATEFFGQLQFDLAEHKLVFSLDELNVFGVAVDLASIIEEAEKSDDKDEKKSAKKEEEATATADAP